MGTLGLGRLGVGVVQWKGLGSNHGSREDGEGKRRIEQGDGSWWAEIRLCNSVPILIRMK
jgi:hypothetical protein